jgi:RNA polymerase sigma-70 factor (ECF subfamily)
LTDIKLNTDLILSLKRGDTESFKLLFHAVYPQLCAYANKFLHDINEAEEIVQEVFYKLWKNRKDLDEDESIKGYLFTSVKNNCFHFIEHQKVKDKYATFLLHAYRSVPEAVGSHEIVVASELEKEFSKALDQLPHQCRKIFELSRVEGLKYAEIANRLNISQKTVETQISRALSKIKLQLKDYILILILFQD